MTELITRLNHCMEQMSSDEIADMLTKLGVRGQIADGTRCPWARFLTMVTKEMWSVGCTGAYSAKTEKQIEQNMRLPYTVGQFVKRFDRREFPALIAASISECPIPDWE